MQVIPAIDLKEGRCVRLRQGRMDDETVFSNDPAAMALHWQGLGASRLHVVDLDGAVGGAPANAKVIEKICKALEIPVQLGGGVRGLDGIARALDLGIERVILGTMAAKDPDMALNAAEIHQGRIVIGIDARGGKVAVQGWTETSGLDYIELAKKLDVPGVAAVVFTDIARDGMSTGTNLASTEQLCDAISRPVIASGGVHTISDIKDLMPLAAKGLAGVITGRAIYEGSLDLAEAIRLAGK